MSLPLLRVSGLSAAYGRAQILFDIALHVERREIVALVGRNGAGKSTVFRTIFGLIDDSHGEIHFGGNDITRRPPHAIARMGVGYVPEDRRIFADLTVLENLEVGRQPPRRDAPVWTIERVFALFPQLADLRHRRCATMSGGEQQMLAVGRALMGNPALLLLDEPSEGLAPRVVEAMADAIDGLKTEGLSVLLSEQNLTFASAVTDRAYVIEKGRIRYEGAMADLLADEGLQRAYLSA